MKLKSKPSTLTVLLSSAIAISGCASFEAAHTPAPEASSKTHWNYVRNTDGECVFTGTWKEGGFTSGCDLGPPVVAEVVEEVAEIEPAAPPPPPPTPEPKLVRETLTLKQDALFVINSYKPTSEGSHAISELADKINSYQEIESIQINGYTDSSGPAEYNKILSEKRANSVKELLVESGVDSSLITTRGFGESDPIASNATPEGRKQNRRVSIVIAAQEMKWMR